MCAVTTKYLQVLVKKFRVRYMFRLYLVTFRIMRLPQKSILCGKSLFVKYGIQELKKL